MTQAFEMAGKVVAITGASSGFGHHFAGTLAIHGATVVLGARRTDKLADRVDEITANGGTAQAHALDVRDKDSINAFFSQSLYISSGMNAAFGYKTDIIRYLLA